MIQEVERLEKRWGESVDLVTEVEERAQKAEAQLASFKEEVMKLKEDNKYKEELGLKVTGLRRTCSNLSHEKAALAAKADDCHDERCTRRRISYRLNAGIANRSGASS